MVKRSYAGEMAWAIEQAMRNDHDRNSNRAAKVGAALKYGFEVELARRDHLPIPPRLDLDRTI